MRPTKRGKKTANRTDTRRGLFLRWTEANPGGCEGTGSSGGSLGQRLYATTGLEKPAHSQATEDDLIESARQLCRVEDWMSEERGEILVALAKTMTELAHRNGGHPPERIWGQYVAQAVRLRTRGSRRTKQQRDLRGRPMNRSCENRNWRENRNRTAQSPNNRRSPILLRSRPSFKQLWRA